jgi:hypothetical protein
MKNSLNWSDIIAFLQARIEALKGRTDSPAMLQVSTLKAAKGAVTCCWNFERYLDNPRVVAKINCQWCANEFQPPVHWVVTCSDECERLLNSPSEAERKLVERAFYELSLIGPTEKARP